MLLGKRYLSRLPNQQSTYAQILTGFALVRDFEKQLEQKKVYLIRGQGYTQNAVKFGMFARAFRKLLEDLNIRVPDYAVSQGCLLPILGKDREDIIKLFSDCKFNLPRLKKELSKLLPMTRINLAGFINGLDLFEFILTKIKKDYNNSFTCAANNFGIHQNVLSAVVREREALAKTKGLAREDLALSEGVRRLGTLLGELKAKSEEEIVYPEGIIELKTIQLLRLMKDAGLYIKYGFLRDAGFFVPLIVQFGYLEKAGWLLYIYRAARVVNLNRCNRPDFIIKFKKTPFDYRELRLEQLPVYYEKINKRGEAIRYWQGVYTDWDRINDLAPHRMRGDRSTPPRSGNAFTQFKYDTDKYRPLEAEEEAELLKEFAKGNNAARDVLIEHNLNQVVKVVSYYSRHYWYSKVEPEDLVDEGVMGLARAIELFDFHKGKRLSTYAEWKIKERVREYIRQQGEIRLPRNIAHDFGELSEVMKKNGGQALPSVESLISELGWPRRKAERILAAYLLRNPEELDRPIKEGEETTLGDLVVAKKDETPREGLAGNEIMQRLIETMNEKGIPERDQDIFLIWHGLKADPRLEGVKSKTEVLAAIYDLTGGRLRRIATKDVPGKLRKVPWIKEILSRGTSSPVVQSQGQSPSSPLSGRTGTVPVKRASSPVGAVVAVVLNVFGAASYINAILSGVSSLIKVRNNKIGLFRPDIKGSRIGYPNEMLLFSSRAPPPVIK